MKYKVIDPKGILVDGERVEEGSTLPEANSSYIKALLRFNQIKEIKAAKSKPNDSESDNSETDSPEVSLDEVRETLREAGVQFAPNLGEKKLRKLFEELQAKSQNQD